MARFDKLLIANRGEIACRIVRTARRMGVRTVAVFSDADRDAMHAALADEAVPIGPSPARESYLSPDVIIDAAHTTGAEAIHPGYGFLSENADFAQNCEAEGLIFVGPTAKTIRLMGSKAAAKALMQQSGVPTVPGYHGEDQRLATLQQEAERIGYPLLVKASAGGGGRGMRLVGERNELPEAVASARREALAAFSDDRILLEKFIANPRHIEVQVFGDSHGNVVSLFERECTLQRRHQKVVEEAPSLALTADRRIAMNDAARVAAKAVGYVNAGTVEFVANDEGFHFIEMNTRLQVEHPVTEAITGLDLVEWQLRVASGERLPLAQAAIAARGHAIEARIYAEDPAKGFLPSIGTIRHWREPAGESIRVDTGFREGDAVTPYYDALLAKLIVSAPDRPAALERMAAALKAFEIGGVTTNIAFLKALVEHPQVRSGDLDTGLIERELSSLTAGEALAPLDLAAACAAVLLREAAAPAPGDEAASPWSRTDGWSMAGRRSRRLIFGYGGQRIGAVVEYARDGLALKREVSPPNANESAAQRFACEPRADDGAAFDITLGGAGTSASAVWSGRDLDLSTPSGRFKLTLVDPYAAEIGEAEAASRIVAPMPGTVARILAQPGAELSRGAAILVLEAMKMEHTLRAPADGRLTALRCAVGDFVQEGAELADFDPIAR